METPRPRGENWESEQRQVISEAFETTAFAFGIDTTKIYREMTPDDRRKATLLVELAMASYGLNINPDSLHGIINDFYPGLTDLSQGMTDNHYSLAVLFCNDRIKYAPVFVGKNEIGAVSPLHIIADGEGGFRLVLLTRNFYWELGPIEFLQPPPHATKIFEESTYGKAIVDACIGTEKGGFSIAYLSDKCKQNCTFCTVDSEGTFIGPDRFEKFRQVLEFMAQNYFEISITLTAGSTLEADGGILKWLKPSLEILEAIKENNPNCKIEAGIEVLPWDKSVDKELLELIGKYYQKGIIKTVALNLETPIGINRNEFMSILKHGKATIPVAGSPESSRSYLRTFILLRESFPEMVLSGVMVYGLKPIDMSWEEYTEHCLETIEQFAAEGVRITLQPLKVRVGEELEGYPLPDLYWLSMAVQEANSIHGKYGLTGQPRVGCVGGCDACSVSHSVEKEQDLLDETLLEMWSS